jgi:hypothetical protein
MDNCEGSVIKIIMYNMYELSRDSCLDKFRNESSYPHFIESSFNIQKEGKCCFFIIESMGNAFYDPCRSSPEKYLIIKSVPQRKHNSSPLKISTG